MVGAHRDGVHSVDRGRACLSSIFSILQRRCRFPMSRSTVCCLFSHSPGSGASSTLVRGCVLSLTGPCSGRSNCGTKRLLLDCPDVRDCVVSGFGSSAELLHFRLNGSTGTFVKTGASVRAGGVSRRALVGTTCRFLRCLGDRGVRFSVSRFTPTDRAMFAGRRTRCLSNTNFELFSVVALTFLRVNVLRVRWMMIPK